MAMEKIPGIPSLDYREAEEIERLLKEEEEKARVQAAQEHPLKKYLSWRVFAGTGVVAGLIFGIGWGVLQWLEKSPVIPEIQNTIQPMAQDRSVNHLVPQGPNMYLLEPFFIPILKNQKETGEFLHATVHLVLSNPRLHKDIDKVRPLIRQGIYSLLTRKKYDSFEKRGVKLEEALKKEIKADSNSYLLSGTGTITHVVFTEFRVSST